jgi:hypothetical protein
MSDQKFKDGLLNCTVCNVALVSAIKDRVDAGEKVKDVCKDYERFQEQLGEIHYTWKQLQDRFRYHYGLDKQSEIPIIKSGTIEEVKAETDKLNVANIVKDVCKALDHDDHELGHVLLEDALDAASTMPQMDKEKALMDQIHEGIRLIIESLKANVQLDVLNLALVDTLLRNIRSTFTNAEGEFTLRKESD